MPCETGSAEDISKKSREIHPLDDWKQQHGGREAVGSGYLNVSLDRNGQVWDSGYRNDLLVRNGQVWDENIGDSLFSRTLKKSKFLNNA